MERNTQDKLEQYFERAGKPITVSPKFFRDYTCPPGCAGCCPRFSLVYHEGERWERLKREYPGLSANFREETINGTKRYVDAQTDHQDRFCRHVDKSNGRCRIHKANPFSCDFELMKLAPKGDETLLINKLFGRGWNYPRTDGGKGAKCEMLPGDIAKLDHDIALLEELQELMELYERKSTLPAVLDYLKAVRASGEFPTEARRFDEATVPDRNDIEIRCTGKYTAVLEELEELQGRLKSASAENIAKLKGSILRHGFIAPIFVWDDGKRKRILDGHQRIRALRELADEGWDIPRLPVDPVFAKNKREAKEMLLHITSQYGEFNIDALDNFIGKSAGAEHARIMDGGIRLLDEFIMPKEEGEKESGPVDMKCPNCGAAWTE